LPGLPGGSSPSAQALLAPSPSATSTTTGAGEDEDDPIVDATASYLQQVKGVLYADLSRKAVELTSKRCVATAAAAPPPHRVRARVRAYARLLGCGASQHQEE